MRSDGGIARPLVVEHVNRSVAPPDEEIDRASERHRSFLRVLQIEDERDLPSDLPFLRGDARSVGPAEESEDALEEHAMPRVPARDSCALEDAARLCAREERRAEARRVNLLEHPVDERPFRARIQARDGFSRRSFVAAVESDRTLREVEDVSELETTRAMIEILECGRRDRERPPRRALERDPVGFLPLAESSGASRVGGTGIASSTSSMARPRRSGLSAIALEAAAVVAEYASVSPA